MRSHREALAELVLLGWTPCGVGDWAVALRSPGGRLAARICPFDPAHGAVCRRCAGSRYLPRIDLVAVLEGGGSLAVPEFLAPAQEATAAQLIRQWKQDEGDAELSMVKATALAVDEEDDQARLPWWAGIDLNQGNVRQSVDGRFTLVDVFCLDGAALYGQILQDPAVGRRLIPADQRRHLLEIPYLARESSPAELHSLQDARGSKWSPTVQHDACAGSGPKRSPRQIRPLAMHIHDGHERLEPPTMALWTQPTQAAIMSTRSPFQVCNPGPIANPASRRSPSKSTANNSPSASMSKAVPTTPG